MSLDYDRRPASAVPAPARIGQGTVVEQTRAAAEVLAALQAAQQCPRNIAAATAEMRQVCGNNRRLAEKAFYSYPRGGQTVTGPTIHLARELARIFGNFEYGIAELRRDDQYHQSEMLAFAKDVEKNTRNSSTFIVPHRRDGQNASILTDPREIYENNANTGARRTREAILATLPSWFVDEAKDLCMKVLQHGGGTPLPQRIANTIEAFTGIGVTVDRIEQKIGRKADLWNVHDVTQLGVTFRSIERGELRVDDEFPQERVSVGEITGQPSPARTPAPAAPAAPVPARAEQLAGMRDLFQRQGADDDEALGVAARIVGRELAVLEELTSDEAGTVIGRLQGIRGSWTEFVAALYGVPAEGGAR